LKPLTAILLAGGFGTRIKELYPDVPKPMIPVANKPFLEWAIQYWARQGVRRFVISLGHLADVAERYFASRATDGLEIVLVKEPRAMGTGGAVRFAAQGAELSDPFLVGNGDSLVLADTVAAQQRIAESRVDGVVLGVRVPDTNRYGSLAIGEESRLLGFREKQPGEGVINAGVYFFRRGVLDLFPGKEPLSMEVDVFPSLLANGLDLRVVAVDAPFLDIGTPESVVQAESFVQAIVRYDCGRNQRSYRPSL
jgi:D-glycero-alpha-D-manno-heptose 1-phosphate guanylyltransferase